LVCLCEIVSYIALCVAFSFEGVQFFSFRPFVLYAHTHQYWLGKPIFNSGNVIHKEVMDTTRHKKNSWHNKYTYLAFFKQKSIKTERKKYPKNNRFHASSCKKHPISWEHLQKDTAFLLY